MPKKKESNNNEIKTLNNKTHISGAGNVVEQPITDTINITLCLMP